MYSRGVLSEDVFIVVWKCLCVDWVLRNHTDQAGMTADKRRNWPSGASCADAANIRSQ